MNNPQELFQQLEESIKKLDPSVISNERKEILQDLIDFIQQKKDNKEAISLNFICTHNSRRSHFSQVWAQALAGFFNIPHVNAYSGGTEATALYPVVVETLENIGFQVEKISETANPVFSIKYGPNILPITAFSKAYSHPFNPQSEFAAIMTCSDADENCPLVMGAEKRFRLTYEDPKAFDGTPLQAEKYNERSLQIATELFHVFSKIK
jgi:arsenate reductase (thioredoxin)